MNKGIKYCLLTNSDIVFKKDSIQILLNDIANNDKCVICGPKIVDMQNRLMPSSMIFPERVIDALEIGRFFPQKRIDENSEKGFHKVYTISGCCFFINCELFKEMGAFDENVFLYNEERILGVLCKNKRLITGIDFNATVIHEHAASSSGIRNDFVSCEYIKSFLYYWYKYRNKGRVLLNVFLNIYCLKMKILSRKYDELHPNKIKTAGRNELKRLFGD